MKRFSSYNQIGTGWMLAFFFLLALIIRLVYAQMLPPVLTGEEAEYARIAENLFAGVGYSGVYGGPQLVHAPLFSLLTALLMPLFGTVQTAGMAVSILAGAGLVCFLFLLGDEVNGRPTAIIAAALAACTPMLIHLSTSLLSEALTLCLMLAAVWITMRLMRSGSWKLAPLMGLLWGLTYLARPTGTLMLLGSLVFLLPAAFWLGTFNLKRVLLAIALALILFGLAAAPYIVFTSSITGQVALEYKSRYINALTARRLAGMSPAEAGFGLDDQRNQAGPQLDQTAFILNQARAGSGSMDSLVSGFVLLGPGHLRRHFGLSLSALTLPLLGLAVLGLLGPPYEKKRLLFNLYLALLALGILLLQLPVPQFVARFAAPLLPFIILFAAQGAAWIIERVSHWLEARNGRSYAAALTAGSVLLLAIMLLLGGQALRPPHAAAAQLLSKKAAGQWLGEQFGRGQVIMDDGTLIPFYAGGLLAPLPFVNEEGALAYIAQQEPDFIVLSGYNKLRLPYAGQWLADGIPSPRAALVYDQPTLDGRRIQIYQWH